MSDRYDEMLERKEYRVRADATPDGYLPIDDNRPTFHVDDDLVEVGVFVPAHDLGVAIAFSVDELKAIRAVLDDVIGREEAQRAH